MKSLIVLRYVIDQTRLTPADPLVLAAGYNTLTKFIKSGIYSFKCSGL